MGIALMRLGKNKQAELYYRKALQEDPSFGEAHYALGTLLASQGRYKEAYRLLPNDPDVIAFLEKFQEHLTKIQDRIVRNRE